jgi:tryptophan-rich sensory protein
MAAATSSAPAGARPRQVTNILAYALVITVNGLANALPINGVTSGEISDQYASLVTPAGYVFSIWGVIYALLAVFVGYQALPAQRDDRRLQRLGYAFAVSCLCNVAWLFAWHYQQIVVAWVLIVALLVTLMVCYERVRGAPYGRIERFAVVLPFSVYLGWVTVATIANTAIVLLDLGVDGGGAAPAWGVLAIAAAVAVGVTMLLRRADIAFNLVLVWALAGIAVAQSQRSGLIVGVAVGACVVLAAIVAWRALSGRTSRPAGV